MNKPMTCQEIESDLSSVLERKWFVHYFFKKWTLKLKCFYREYMAHSFHNNVSVDGIFFFAKCYRCLGGAYSVTGGILIYVIENIYLYRE